MGSISNLAMRRVNECFAAKNLFAFHLFPRTFLRKRTKKFVMYTIYRLKANELDEGFLKSLKAMFKNKEIEIAVAEVAEIEEDETAYLLKSPANRERLLKAVENVAQGRSLVAKNLDELE